MHFAFQKGTGRQTLDKFHIFIMVPVLKISILFFSPICSQHRVYCGTVIPPTTADTIQNKSPLQDGSSPGCGTDGGCLARELTISQTGPVSACPAKPGRNKAMGSPKMTERRITFKETDTRAER